MVVAMADPNEIMLHGVVGASMWDDDDGITAKALAEALAGASGDVLIRLNSGGGDAFEGAAIHATLAGYKRGRVTIRVEGIAASAASLLAMAGDEVVMAEGAVMMIHDPSGFTMGNAADHRATAETLDKLATEYATVYARRCGCDVTAMRDMMREEVWMTAQEAVDLGFADRVETKARPEREAEPPAMAAFPYHEYQSAPARLVAMAQARDWRAGGPRAEPAAPPATEKEAIMAATEKPADAKAPEMKADPAAVAALAADARRKAVMAIAGQKLTGAQVEEIVTATADPAEAKMAAVDKICEMRMAEEPEAPKRPRATITVDADERRAEAMIGALSHAMFRTPLEGAAQEYRGMTLKKLAIEMAGGPRFGYSDHELVKRGMEVRGVVMAGGMHSTSDFSYLTASTVNRALRAAYEARPGNWRRISRERSASDFRTLYSVQSGADVTMKAVNEAGEYQGTTLTDTGESFAVARYGREVHLTFELVVNDDMSALSRLPIDFARGALNLESRIAWGLINANAAMSDSVALFHANHGNLAGSGGAISTTTVGAGRKAMWEQRPAGADTATGGDDYISAVPNLMVVPPALEVTALSFVTGVTPRNQSDVNPFTRTVEVEVTPYLGATATSGSNTAWYLFDTSLPTIEHAFLDGYEAPMVETEEKRNPKGITLTAEHIFGAGVVEFRGAYKNAGA